MPTPDSLREEYEQLRNQKNEITARMNEILETMSSTAWASKTAQK